MRTRFLRGNRTDNNGLTLPAGELSFDSETKALRIHDGETPGGFEIVGQQAYAPPFGPGPETIIAGNETTGFFGEVTGEELITYSGLSSAVGLSVGTLQHDAESLWLKFVKDGEILYVAKKPSRHSVSWDAISAANAVYNDINAPTIVVGDRTLRVTLLTGGNGDPSTAAGGEWNRLLYPIHVDDPDTTAWGVNYTNADLVMGTGNGTGAYCWTQETISGDTTSRVNRGGQSLTYYLSTTSTASSSSTGWRPVLRLQPQA